MLPQFHPPLERHGFRESPGAIENLAQAQGLEQLSASFLRIRLTKRPESSRCANSVHGRPEPVIGLLLLTAELHTPVVRPRSAGMRSTAALRLPTASTGTRPFRDTRCPGLAAAKQPHARASCRHHKGRPAQAEHRRGRSLHELQRQHQVVRGAVVPGRLQLQHDLAGSTALHALISLRRTAEVAAELLQRLAVVGAAAHGRVQPEPATVGAQNQIRLEALAVTHAHCSARGRSAM